MKKTYRFNAEYVEDDLRPGQWALWAGKLEHPDGTIEDAWCQGGYHGVDPGDMDKETLEDQEGYPIKLPDGATFN